MSEVTEIADKAGKAIEEAAGKALGSPEIAKAVEETAKEAVASKIEGVAAGVVQKAEDKAAAIDPATVCPNCNSAEKAIVCTVCALAKNPNATHRVGDFLMGALHQVLAKFLHIKSE